MNIVGNKGDPKWRESLQIVYADMFGVVNYKFFRERIDLNTGAWMADLRSILDDDCLRRVALSLSGRDKIIEVIKYLRKENNIGKYKKFIEIWKKHDPARAQQFDRYLKQIIQNSGLEEYDI